MSSMLRTGDCAAAGLCARAPGLPILLGRGADVLPSSRAITSLRSSSRADSRDIVGQVKPPSRFVRCLLLGRKRPMLVTWGCARELLDSLSLQQWNNSEAGVWSCLGGGRIAAVYVLGLSVIWYQEGYTKRLSRLKHHRLSYQPK